MGKFGLDQYIRIWWLLAQTRHLMHEAREDELCLRVQKNSPDLVDKQGVLVVKAAPLNDLAHITQRERLRRASDLVRRVGL